MKVACFSVAAMDFFPQQNEHYAGGNSLNQAIRFCQMGYQSAFVGAVGTDETGKRIYKLLESTGVDTTHTYQCEGNTARNTIINDETGERFGIEGAWQGGVYQDFKLREADWTYLDQFDIWATHANGPNFPQAAENKRIGQFLCVDFLHIMDVESLQKYQDVMDIAYIGGTKDMAESLSSLASRTRNLIVLTLGAGGSMAFHKDQVFRQPALTIEKVVDTTGCGDAFQAGFSASFFRTHDIRTSLLAGAEMGRRAALTYGGVPWV